MFEHKGVHQCTWHQDTLGRRSMMDFVIVVSSDFWPYVLDTRVKRGAELSTDHHLVMMLSCWLHQARTPFSMYWERFAAECEAAGMRISTSKSEAMVLDRKRVACPLWVGGEILPQVEGVQVSRGLVHK
ncbi:hypothetical protein L3Q82_002472 [Scortum barcoo]|uniref:Uncharacterized protein n=1 Tax=Scortum barcoo TaxID=214431 RepID=A0ACB8VYG2_9TELE|nr:hypothetical protein L3Q82_002472 [Scortum barcoo]